MVPSSARTAPSSSPAPVRRASARTGIPTDLAAFLLRREDAGIGLAQADVRIGRAARPEAVTCIQRDQGHGLAEVADRFGQVAERVHAQQRIGGAGPPLRAAVRQFVASGLASKFCLKLPVGSFRPNRKPCEASGLKPW